MSFLLWGSSPETRGGRACFPGFAGRVSRAEAAASEPGLRDAVAGCVGPSSEVRAPRPKFVSAPGVFLGASKLFPSPSPRYDGDLGSILQPPSFRVSVFLGFLAVLGNIFARAHLTPPPPPPPLVFVCVTSKPKWKPEP